MSKPRSSKGKSKGKTFSLSNNIVPSYKYLLTNFTVGLMFLIGSRKSAKTKHIALRFITRIIADPTYNAVAFRKVNKTIWDSIKTELDWAINLLGVGKYFEYNKTRQEYTYLPNQTLIKLRSIETDTTTGKTKISGLNVSHGLIKDAWLEEAYEFTYADYTMITQTLRGGMYTILFSANPYVSTHWMVAWANRLLPQKFKLMKRFGQQYLYDPGGEEGLGVIVHWSNWYMNTKLSEFDKKERLAEKKRDPKKYLVTGYGMAGNPEGTILGDLLDHIQFIDYDDAVSSVYKLKGGVDYGLVKDATTCTLGGFTPEYQDLVMFDEYWHSNGEETYSHGNWRRFDITDYVHDVVAFFVDYIDIIKMKGGIQVEVDNAEHGFIQLLNKYNVEMGYGQWIKFVPSYKPLIEDRVIFERAMLSMDKLYFVNGKMTLLYAELENLLWKVTNDSKPIRDESSFSNHITDGWEYLWTKEMYQMIPGLKGGKHYANQ